MPMRHCIALLAAALVALLAAFGPVPAGTPQDKSDDTQLTLYMKDINKGLRALRSMLRDPARNEEAMGEVRGLQILVTKARGERPAMLKDVPEADRAEMATEYQRTMIDFAMKLLELEATILGGDNEAAQEQWRAINGIKSPAHEKFRVKDD